MVKEPKTSKGTDNLSVGNIEMAATLSPATLEGTACREIVIRSSAFSWSDEQNESRKERVLYRIRLSMTGLKDDWNLTGS